LNQRNPWYAFIMLLLMFSMPGLPPTVGSGESSSSCTHFEPLHLAGGDRVLSLWRRRYYLRVVKLMYFDAPTDHARDRTVTPMSAR